LIGLGSNLGDRERTLNEAVERLTRAERVRLIARSRWHQTNAVGGPPGQGPFLNGVVLVETSLRPEAVWGVLVRIETELGRRRHARWGPRTVDLDLLLYDEVVLESDRLVVPHPRMAWRRFVLEPAAEVAPDMVCPTIGWSVSRLLDHLNTATPYVAIAGPIAAGKTQLAGQLAASGTGTLLAEQVSAERLEALYGNSYGTAWEVEIEFLGERARLLRSDRPQWSHRRRLWVSDFWFDQCLAYASVWLRPNQLDAYRPKWEEARRTVVSPKLTVLLDAPAGVLVERIRRRGRPAEMALTEDQLQRIRQAILARADQPDLGPLLRLTRQPPDRALTEALAAVEAMG
jgi:2-amino-4-hydroxy-6-hydroxymethyldihydropteridine diphosphokinase